MSASLAPSFPRERLLARPFERKDEPRPAALLRKLGVDEGVAAPGSLARNIHKVQTSKVGTGGELARDG